MDLTERKITKIAREASKLAVRTLKEDGIGTAEYDFIHLVRHHPGITQAEVREQLRVDKGAAARRAASLEAKGYLVRTEDENDARSKNVRALPPALEIHSQGKGLSEQFFDQVTGDFSTEERELLDQLLGRMLEKGKALAAAPAPEKEVRP